MLKNFKELSEIDVSQHCDKRKAKGDNGKDIDVLYLNWAVCKKLLHENGAERVVFTPIRNAQGSSLFHTDRVFGEGDKTNQCYEVGVHVVIDDLEFDFWGPLMNGSNPVRDNSISQQRVWNCQTRLFVKGVAMYTGLGFGLWLKEEQADEKTRKYDDLESHDVMKIRERIERAITNALDKGFTLEQIAKKTEIGNEADDVKSVMRYCTKLYNFEGMLRELVNDTRP